MGQPRHGENLDSGQYRPDDGGALVADIDGQDRQKDNPGRRHPLELARIESENVEQSPGLRQQDVAGDAHRAGQPETRQHGQPDQKNDQGCPGQLRLFEWAKQRERGNTVEDEDRQARIQ